MANFCLLNYDLVPIIVFAGTEMTAITITKIAAELGVNKDYALRLVKRRAAALGIRPQRGPRNAVSLSREDADRLIQDYRPRSRRPSLGAGQTGGFGYFYVIQLHPDDLRSRLKIGYTDNMDVRLSDHRTAAPTLRLVKSWPCKRSWEEAAKASITRGGCRCIGGEVFDGDVREFIQRADAFFSIMPGAATSLPETRGKAQRESGEPPGAANRSQPVAQEAGRASLAAGSGG